MISSLISSPSHPALEPEITEITGITNGMLKEFGKPFEDIVVILEGICEMHRVEYIVAHNGSRFDQPMLYSELDRHKLAAKNLRDIPWIDTLKHLPFPKEPESKKLNHLALDAGFISPFKHRAVFDVLTMLRIMSHFDFEKVIALSKVPRIIVRAVVDYENRQIAKDHKFSWEKVGELSFPKFWVREIPETELENLRARMAPFKIGVLRNA